MKIEGVRVLKKSRKPDIIAPRSSEADLSCSISSNFCNCYILADAKNSLHKFCPLSFAVRPPLLLDIFRTAGCL